MPDSCFEHVVIGLDDITYALPFAAAWLRQTTAAADVQVLLLEYQADPAYSCLSYDVSVQKKNMCTCLTKMGMASLSGVGTI